jgi:FkbM family methyltransferase
MINFNDVNRPNAFSADNFLGKVLRLPLRLIPRDTVLPILQGPGRGLKWIVGSYNHGCWLGSYEYEKQLVLADLVKKGDVVYDLGAHVGYFSIIFSRLVGDQGMVYAFEPFISNYEFICRHLELNRVRNLQPIQAGISVSSGIASFQPGPNGAMGRKSEAGSIQFPVYNLLEYIQQHQLRQPTLIKMDIEGEEASVVPSMAEYCRNNKIKLMISTHSDQITEGIVLLLQKVGFRVTPLQWSNRPEIRTLTNATLLLAEL